MKKILIYLLPVCLLATSCKKFLEETSPDEIRPSSTEDLYAFMISDAYPYSATLENFSDMLTDDVKSYGMPRNTNGTINTAYSSYYENGRGIFAFDPQELEGSTGTASTTLDAWKNYYSRIKGCNIVIDYAAKVKGSDQAKDALHGQALILRGFYYLKLAQLYCLPYNGTGVQPETAMGLPLILSMQVSDEHVGRSSLKATFDQIEKDMIDGTALVKASYTAPTPFRLSHIAAYALLSRFHLYRGTDADMDKVIEYADEVISEKPALTPLKNYVVSNTSLNPLGIYDQASSTEVLWQYGFNSKGINTFMPATGTYTSFHAPYAVSDELRNMYEKGNGTDNKGDLRYTLNFAKYTVSGAEFPSRSLKIGLNATAGDKGIRTGEVYITRAEAYARRFKKSGQDADRVKALSDLNTLRLSRYDTRTAAYTPVSFTDADALLKFCTDERRREMSLEENSRWADIKRQGLSVTHNFIDAEGNSTIYTLPANSPLYALPIPVTAISRNNNLVPNPR